MLFIWNSYEMAQTVSDEAKGKSEPIQLTFIDRSAHCFDVDGKKYILFNAANINSSNL